MLDNQDPIVISTDPGQPMVAGVNVMSRALGTTPHHPVIEQMVDIICNKTSNQDRPFFRVVSAYFMAKMAASMRAVLKTADRGDLPVNVYAVALANSGFGKGHSIAIIEKQFIGGFKKRLLDETFPVVSAKHLYDRACDKALLSGKSPEDEQLKLEKDFALKGAYTFTFDSGTKEGVRQIRDKLLLAGIGSINFQVDEIGSNLIGNTDILTLFFELYDQGEIKTKLVMSTSEKVRGEELDGKTPANALLFGTPATLYDGFTVEEKFQAFLEAGYGRRSIFAWGCTPDKNSRARTSGRDKYRQKIQPINVQTVDLLANQFALLADPSRFGWQITVPDTIGEELSIYEEICIARAASMATHDTVRKAEMEHRYFKTLKLAGAMSFVDGDAELTMDTLYQAIKLVEESGEAFDNMLKREKNYVRLARYIAEKGGELTHPELNEALPFYKSGTGARTEIMGLARDWGYRNHIIIRKSFKEEGIEVFTGETLQKTNLDRILFSWSEHMAFNYNPDQGPFDQLSQLVQGPGLHWCNHTFENQHRAEVNAHPGFNMIVLDIDGGIPLHVAHDLMKDHMFMTCTTKRHTDAQHRFRMLIPTNYVLKLDDKDYKAFMTSVCEWLPFPAPVDEAANQRSRKWLSNPGAQIHYNLEAQPLDVLPFLPRTTRNDAHKEKMSDLQSLDNLERWFAQRIEGGNRNNQMLKYALALVDGGLTYSAVEEAVLSFNSRLPNRMSEDEIRNSILVTAAKKIRDRV